MKYWTKYYNDTLLHLYTTYHNILEWYIICNNISNMRAISIFNATAKIEMYSNYFNWKYISSSNAHLMEHLKCAKKKTKKLSVSDWPINAGQTLSSLFIPLRQKLKQCQYKTKFKRKTNYDNLTFEVLRYSPPYLLASFISRDWTWNRLPWIHFKIHTHIVNFCFRMNYV